MHRANQLPRNKGSRAQKNKGMPLAARKLLVQQANKQSDVLSLCADLPMTHTIGDSEYYLEHKTSANTDQAVKTWLLDLTRENIKEKYLESGWGWSDEEKSDELWHSSAQYLLVRNSTTQELIGFTHFRFDMDYGSHVLYCYELQVCQSQQGGGLGAWLMQLLHSIARGSNMSKVVLTVGKNNPRALKFYFGIGYRVDETSPCSLKDTKPDGYLILSCGCKDNKENEHKKR